MGVSLSRRGKPYSGNQWRVLVALHLLIDKPAHGALAEGSAYGFLLGG